MGKEAGGDAGSGTLDWTGYWRLVKSDHFDEYLKVGGPSVPISATPHMMGRADTI